MSESVKLHSDECRTSAVSQHHGGAGHHSRDLESTLLHLIQDFSLLLINATWTLPSRKLTGVAEHCCALSCTTKRKEDGEGLRREAAAEGLISYFNLYRFEIRAGLFINS